MPGRRRRVWRAWLREAGVEGVAKGGGQQDMATKVRSESLRTRKGNIPDQPLVMLIYVSIFTRNEKENKLGKEEVQGINNK